MVNKINASLFPTSADLKYKQTLHNHYTSDQASHQENHQAIKRSSTQSSKQENKQADEQARLSIWH